MSKWKIAKLVIGGLFAMSGVAMGVAAATADSDRGVRSDGSRARDGVQGDPKGGSPPYHEESATPDTEGGRSSDPEGRSPAPAEDASS